MSCLFYLKLPITGKGFWATFRKLCFADRQTDLFGGSEFIAPDILFKTMNARALNNRGYLDRCTNGGLAVGHTF